ncbi:MAG: PAS domain-containing protein [Rhodospirillales bacterium]
MSGSGNERFFDKDDIIVSKTDLKGRLTYANDIFLSIADYKEAEVLGQPHSLIRNPDMPRAVFKLLWDRISSGREIFAYVVNRTKFGDYYWVLAHVTPSRDSKGEINGYHSNRRVPDRQIIQDTIIPMYGKMRRLEDDTANRKDGMAASAKLLEDFLKNRNQSYDEFIARIQQAA